MSTLDLFVPGFPHGTSEGFARGCRSNGACPRDEDGIQTCQQASIRIHSDWEYSKLVQAGVSELEAARQLGAKEPAPRLHEHKVPEPVFEEPTVFEDEKKAARPMPRPAFSKAQEAAAKPITKRRRLALDDPEFPHGTYAGFQRGCIDPAACPAAAAGELSCREAKTKYQREAQARRRENARGDGTVEAAPLLDPQMLKAQLAVATEKIERLSEMLAEGAELRYRISKGSEAWWLDIVRVHEGVGVDVLEAVPCATFSEAIDEASRRVTK